MQQQRRLWRECAFIAEAYVGQTSRLRHGKHTLHTEERNVHLMWSRLNLPGSTSIRCRGSPRWGWREQRRRSGYVRFALNGILQARLEQDIASCRMFDLPSKPPSTLEPSSSPSHSNHPFLRATFIRLRRFSRTSSISAISTERSNKGYYAAVGK